MYWHWNSAGKWKKHLFNQGDPLQQIRSPGKSFQVCCHIWAVSRQGSGDWWCPCLLCLDEIPYCYSVSSSQQGHYLHQQSSGPLGALLSFVMSSLEFVVTQQSQNWLVSSQLVQKRDPWAWVGQGEYCGLPSQALGGLEKKNPTTAAALDRFYQQQCDVGFFWKKLIDWLHLAKTP